MIDNEKKRKQQKNNNMHLESSYHTVHFSSHSVGSVTQSKLTAEQSGFHQLNKHLII